MQRTRILGIAFAIALLASGVAARLIWMQGVEWRDYRAMAERTRRSTKFFAAGRGKILDARGRTLAEDVPAHDIHYSLEGVIETRWVARRVWRLLGQSDDGFPYDEERLFSSLDSIRRLYGVRLGGEVPIPPHLWIKKLTSDQAKTLRAALDNPTRAPYYPGLVLGDDESLYVDPRALFAGEAGIRRLERRLAAEAPERDVVQLFDAVEVAYQDMRNPVIGLKEQLRRVEAALDNVESENLDSKARAKRRRELWDRLEWLESKIGDRGYHRKVRQRLFERDRLLVDDVPFSIVSEVVENPSRYPGLRIRERRRRVSHGGRALGNLLGRVGARTAEVDLEWREDGEPVLDSWLAHHGRLQRIQDIRTFRAIQTIAHHSEDRVGVRGLERMLEDRLSGRPGARNLEVDVRGESQGGPLWDEPPVPGEDVQLTLDAELCEIVYGFIDEQSPYGASAIFGDPRTGEIHAWVSYPSLDPNRRFESREEFSDFLRANPGILLNRPVQSEVEPGSTFKTAVAVAGLAEGLIGADEEYLCEGAYNLAKPDQLRCRNHSLSMTLDVRQALARSCNCYFYVLGGDRLGADGIREWGTRLHLWDREGNGIRGGRTWGRPPTARGTRPLLGIGRGFTVRPIGVFRLTCGIANRGLFVPARLVADESGGKPDRVDVAPHVWEAVIDGMTQAVQYGTASSAKVGLHRFDCAVKTGTAETRWFEKRPDGTRELVIGNTAWLIGFAPVADPKVAFTICVERAADGVHGGEACGQITARTLEWYGLRRGLPVEQPR